MMEQNEIEVRRTIVGWTQEQLAKQANLAPATIVRAEAGKPILVQTLRDIEKALDVGLRLKQGGGDA